MTSDGTTQKHGTPSMQVNVTVIKANHNQL